MQKMFYGLNIFCIQICVISNFEAIGKNFQMGRIFLFFVGNLKMCAKVGVVNIVVYGKKCSVPLNILSSI